MMTYFNSKVLLMIDTNTRMHAHACTHTHTQTTKACQIHKQYIAIIRNQAYALAFGRLTPGLIIMEIVGSCSRSAEILPSFQIFWAIC